MSVLESVPSIPKIIYIMGIDGSGKTTVSEHLAEQLRARGYTVNVLWLRFNHVISKPLLGFCRVLGLTRYECHGDIKVGYHDFYRSRIVSWLFVFFQYLDAVRVKYLKVLPNIKADKNVLILDRYVHDILIDVMVDTRMEKLDKGKMGRAFKALIPEGALLVLVDRDLDKVLEVRPEGQVDENFEHRYQFYKKLALDPNIHTVKNDASLEALLGVVEGYAGLRQ